jgi:hypothetical protein
MLFDITMLEWNLMNVCDKTEIRKIKVLIGSFFHTISLRFPHRGKNQY